MSLDLIPVNPAWSWGDSNTAVPVGVVLLELTVAAADPEVTLYKRAERVACWMVNHDFGRVVELVARIVDSIAELLVTARDEPFVEGADVFEKFMGDKEAAGRGVVMALEKFRDREPSAGVVPTCERGVVGFDKTDVRREVVGVPLVDHL